jgi:hypothetical protein
MRREIIEFVRQFKQDIMELETEVLFISEEDIMRMKEYLEEFKRVLREHSQRASELERKIDAMLKI